MAERGAAGGLAPDDAAAGGAAPDGGAADGPRGAPDLDRTIVNRAILAGGLELLPQSLATMAIVPVQMKLVHEIGRVHGYALDGAGRRRDQDQLRSVFTREIERGRALFDRYQGQVRHRASTTDPSQLTRHLRG